VTVRLTVVSHEKGDEYVIEPRETKQKSSTRTPGQKAEADRLRQGARRVTRKSDVANTKSISNAADNQGVSWTIGSEPTANSKVVGFAQAS